MWYKQLYREFKRKLHLLFLLQQLHDTGEIKAVSQLEDCMTDQASVFLLRLKWSYIWMRAISVLIIYKTFITFDKYKEQEQQSKNTIAGSYIDFWEKRGLFLSQL